MKVFVNRTVLAPAVRAKEGIDSRPADETNATAVPFIPWAVVAQPPPLGGVSETTQLLRLRSRRSGGVADSPLPSAAVVKADGQELKATCVLAWGEPAGALITEATFRVAGGEWP